MTPIPQTPSQAKGLQRLQDLKMIKPEGRLPTVDRPFPLSTHWSDPTLSLGARG